MPVSGKTESGRDQMRMPGSGYDERMPVSGKTESWETASGRDETDRMGKQRQPDSDSENTSRMDLSWKLGETRSNENRLQPDSEPAHNGSDLDYNSDLGYSLIIFGYLIKFLFDELFKISAILMIRNAL